MSAVDITGEEMFGSLTGYDELAIAKNFHAEIGVLAGDRPTMFLRAMVFIHFRREGDADADALKKVMDLSLSEAQEFFAENREVDEDDPVTPSGKGSTPLA